MLHNSTIAIQAIRILMISIAMQIRDTQGITMVISSNRATHIHSLSGHIKTQVLHISLFPHFRIQGLMLGLQVIQPLITILVIIRQLEVTQVAVTTIRQHHGVKAVMRIIHLINILTMLPIQVVLIVPALHLLVHYSTNNITSNGQTITVKRKFHVLLGQRNYLFQLHLILAQSLLQQVGIQAQISSHCHRHRRCRCHPSPHLGGLNPIHLI